MHNIPHSQEAKDKIRKAHLGKSLWPEGRIFSKRHKKRLSESHKGQIAWNKGKKGLQVNTGRTHFKKGHVPWNKGIKFSQIKGKKNILWKGEKVSYNGLHKWVARELGKPKKCEGCNRNNLTGKSINWANKSHKYKRDLRDWIRLCRSCHFKYDGQNLKNMRQVRDEFSR